MKEGLNTQIQTFLRTDDKMSTALKGIARHLTGSDIESLKNQYTAKNNTGYLKTRTGKTITNKDFETLAQYLRISL